MREKIIKLFSDFGEGLTIDLRESLVESLRKHGRKSPNDPKLKFDQRLKTTEGGDVVLDILAYDKYWRYIETGRKPGARRIPADALGKVWQNQNNIDARKVILSIRAKRNRGLNLKKTELNYDKAAKSLSFIIQKSIFKRGIKPKPFIDRVVEDGRFTEFRSALIPLLGDQYKLVIKGLE